MTQQIASRDWHTRATVRVLRTVTRRSHYGARTFGAGEELEMIQWGRAGRPVERDAWWTDFDIDGAYIVEASNVKVVKILEEVAPRSRR